MCACSGRSLADIRLLVRRCPPSRWRPPGLRLSCGTWEGAPGNCRPSGVERESPSPGCPVGRRNTVPSTPTDRPVVVMKPLYWGGAKQPGRPWPLFIHPVNQAAAREESHGRAESIMMARGSGLYTSSARTATGCRQAMSASRFTAGQGNQEQLRPQPLSLPNGPKQLVEPGKAQLRVGLDPDRSHHAEPPRGPCSAAASSADFPVPGSPTMATACPWADAVAMISDRVSSSRRRPMSCGGVTMPRFQTSRPPPALVLPLPRC